MCPHLTTTETKHFQGFDPVCLPVRLRKIIVNNSMADKIRNFFISCYYIMLGIKRLVKVTMEAIYEITQEQPLFITVQQRQANWIGNAIKREENEMPRIVAIYEPSHGRAPLGCAFTSYKTYISALITHKTRNKYQTCRETDENGKRCLHKKLDIKICLFGQQEKEKIAR